MSDETLRGRAETVRRFNRFYTKQIGLLQDGLLKSPFSLSEARIIYELAQHETSTASQLAAELNLDAGYLSRVLSKFEKQGQLARQPDRKDGRQMLLSLTGEGRQAYELLNSRSQAEIEAMLAGLAPAEQARLVASMETIRGLLGERPGTRAPYLLRPLRPGDLGWVVQRHGVIYSQEYGWNEEFEALVAEIVAHYVQNLDPKRENCWIAERDGENVGCVFVVKKSESVAKLRCLLVEPVARGSGIGSRLVEECLRFARRCGYNKMTLWTNSVLLAARRIYAAAGFHLVESEPNRSFGHDLVSETWEKEL